MADRSALGAGLGVLDSVVEDPCAMDNGDEIHELRIGAIFIILVTSLFGTLLPLILKQSRVVPRSLFDFFKFFGSGVIIATAFIHLLAPAFDALGSECLSGVWTEYDFAPAIAMAAVYAIFFAEVAAYRMGSKRLERLGMNYTSHQHDETDAHAHSHQNEPPLGVDTSAPEHPFHGAHDHPHNETDAAMITSLSSPTPSGHATAQEKEKKSDLEALDGESINQMPSRSEAAAQLIAVAVLEFGVVLHSVIIGLTLATNTEFKILFIVIIFHQMFEGLGLGSRLSALRLPNTWKWAPYLAGAFYSICTPVGMAIGLGIRESYNGNGATANIVSGVLDATSAGILLYTGLVELLAHEILLNPRAMKSSSTRLNYIFGCMLLGSGLMALLGRWA